MPTPGRWQRRWRRLSSPRAGLVLACVLGWGGWPAHSANHRPSKDDTELVYWLRNMVWYHRFDVSEIEAATGLSPEQIASAQKRWNIHAGNRPARTPGEPLLVLPYPGGRHPRIGFLDGAVDPQRETKLSVFTPWDPAAYVVLDVPEAIWSNLGLTYLAHTHIDTIWTKRGIAMEPLEWNRREDGSFDFVRTLPNGIAFGTKARPGKDGVRMDMWLKNGSDQPLSDLRVQNCVMLKAAPGFNQLTNANKVIDAPYVACRNDDGTRWIITAWVPNDRPWANAPVPCLHSDPKFPDCAPGETNRLRGWLSFYEGTDVRDEFKRLDTLGWKSGADGETAD